MAAHNGCVLSTLGTRSRRQFIKRFIVHRDVRKKNVLIDIVQVVPGLRLRERRISNRNVTLIGSDVSECLSFCHFHVDTSY